MFIFFKNIFSTLVILLALDFVWLHFVTGSFFAKQLSEIGRFDSTGAWNARILPAALVYVLMALAIEIFIFQNPAIKGMKAYVMHGALLGLIIYGVFDGTNRAIIEHYPMNMVMVDVFWGVVLFSCTTWVQFLLRKQFNIF